MSSRTLLLVALILSPTAVAQEWTRFRGPDGQGIGKAEDLPAKPSAVHVRWRVRSGKGHSSPVLWGRKLFLTRVSGKPGEREVVCRDADTGEERWATARAFEAYRQHNFNSFASSTPAVDGKGIYVVWSTGSVLVAVAFDHLGKRLWRRELGAFSAQHGSGTSPIVYGDLVIVANENEGGASFLIALDKSSGKPRWRIARRTARLRGAYSCPIVFEPREGSPFLLFTSTAHGLTAVDPEAGKVLWETDLQLSQRCVNSPVVSGDLVFFSGGSGGGGKESAFVRIPKTPAAKPEVVRRPRRAIPYVPSALALEGRFYVVTDGGVARCMEGESGREVWRGRLDGGFFSSPVTNGKTIYIVSRQGVLFSFSPGEEFEQLGAFDLGGKVFATPAIARGVMYVRTFDELICLGAVLPEKVKIKTPRKN